MLSNLFQDSDVILFMDSGLDKRPHTGVLQRMNAAVESKFPSSRYPYYAVNPIDHAVNRNVKGEQTQRAAINVSAFRNFLFEIDSLELAAQEPLIRFLHTKLPFAQVTFSGGTSLHAIVSVADSLPFKVHTESGIAQYSLAWRALNAELTALASDFLGPACPGRLFDPSCKDPCRLSRTPNALRPDTGLIQSELEGFGGYVSSDEIQALMHKHGFNELSVAPKVQPVSDMDMKLFKLRLLYPENHGLRSKLVNVKDWAASENMYPVLFQLTLWIIDSVGAPLSTTLAFMDANIFPAIKAAGYPRNPAVAIHNAYNWKGLT